MKECIKCKTQLEDDELFCHECGTKQEIEESEAQVEGSGATEEKYCIHCGEAIEAESMFCPFCGKPQDVEKVNEDEPQPKTEEPEPRPTETEEVETKQQEPVAPPQPEQPQKEPAEIEQAKTNKQDSVLPPRPESSEQPEHPKQPEQPEAEEQPTYEWEEEKKSKTWLWILLALLIVGGIGVWYYMSDDFSYNDNQELSEALDTDSIEEPDEYMDYEEIVPTSELEFLKLFYKGDLNEDEHIRQNVTNDLIGKLMADYDYDCPTNDCLAYWVFAAYPAGADMELEEGPYITATDIASKYKVDFKYSFYNGEQKGYETRTVYLTVTKMDGKYLISDYEIVDAGDKEESQVNDMYSESGESQPNSTEEKSQNSEPVTSRGEQLINAWFVFGTKDELKGYGILNESQGLRENFEKNYFTKIDTRVNRVIKLYSRSAKILTSHPANAYTLELDVNKQYVLKITDPQLFWSTSEYLVILIK